MKYIIINLVLFTLFFNSCDKDTTATEEKIIRINHYKTIGFGPFLGFYHLIQEEENKFDTDEWNIFYNSITGLDYELGYVYKVNVRITKIDNPPADGSAYDYELIELISKEKVEKNTKFEIKLKQLYSESSESYVTGTIENGFKIINQITIDCGKICEELKDVQNTKQLENSIGTFKHTNSSDTIELLKLTKK